MESSSQQVSHLLQRWGDGDSEALAKLMPLVYDELRRMARRYMKGQPAGQTLQTTALIHEAYLRLAGQEKKHWDNRAHFFGGLTEEEIGEALKISTRTVRSEWRLARSWLLRELGK